MFHFELLIGGALNNELCQLNQMKRIPYGAWSVICFNTIGFNSLILELENIFMQENAEQHEAYTELIELLGEIESPDEKEVMASFLLAQARKAQSSRSIADEKRPALEPEKQTCAPRNKRSLKRLKKSVPKLKQYFDTGGQESDETLELEDVYLDKDQKELPDQILKRLFP